MAHQRLRQNTHAALFGGVRERGDEPAVLDLNIERETQSAARGLRDARLKTARFVPRGRVDTEEAVAGTPRAIVVELR